jgi:hypothetical protein
MAFGRETGCVSKVSRKLSMTNRIIRGRSINSVVPTTFLLKHSAIDETNLVQAYISSTDIDSKRLPASEVTNSLSML